ncbi:MAG: hypothetical protein LBS56_06995, partial [Propionibacteriaceae bacterium]|nr:hypothetical protein [Propionibacteriaceae bacterium]
AGNISVQADRVAAALDLETQAGNIRVETTRLAADLFAVTTAGNVNVRLGEDTQAWFRLSASDIKNAFDRDPTPPQGSPTVSLSSKVGSIRVKKVRANWR